MAWTCNYGICKLRRLSSCIIMENHRFSPGTLLFLLPFLSTFEIHSFNVPINYYKPLAEQLNIYRQTKKMSRKILKSINSKWNWLRFNGKDLYTFRGLQMSQDKQTTKHSFLLSYYWQYLLHPYCNDPQCNEVINLGLNKMSININWWIGYFSPRQLIHGICRYGLAQRINSC